MTSKSNFYRNIQWSILTCSLLSVKVEIHFGNEVIREWFPKHNLNCNVAEYIDDMFLDLRMLRGLSLDA